ncbi:thioredoxin reductase 1, cytoplasmic-like isoform X2 [Littorina saxatilis]|uniref:thioredoxin-disulfide reductase (NADPH) n=2 Tax=Littorina saxatilis TaxID=31220 RepID=A0AAN9BET6_9CAEN
MPPTTAQGADVVVYLQELINSNKVMVFSKTTCPFCLKIKDLFKSLNVQYGLLELDNHEDGNNLQTALFEMSGQKTVPNVFVNGKHLGGCDDTLKAHADNRLIPLINSLPVQAYEYDLIVIGGGSGGLAAAKEAAGLGKKVALLDYVSPSPQGTTWGLGGTCVNVGCIPKKLMHRAAVLGEQFSDAKAFGWEVPEGIKHNWDNMKNAIQDHIGSLNWGYRVQLRDKKVNYINGYGEFLDNHCIKATKRNETTVEMTSEYFLVATGERPRYPNIPGAKEFAISSDDLFSLDYCPGKTLCIGASYVSLECAGFLAGIGLDVTVMVRSILLRGFDQQCAEIIGDYMKNHKVKFLRGAVPSKIEQIEAGKPGRYRVTAQTTDGKEVVEEYNTILLAVGRDPCTSNIGLDKVGVDLNPKTGRVLCNDQDQSSTAHIYAIGDIVETRPQLTPVAIQAGRLLSRRLFAGSSVLCDYVNVATTVFTPIEYGAIGYSEEDATEKFGEDNIEVYHSNFFPLEWSLPHREENVCYAKVICNKAENERVIGFHVIGPDAGEMTQGFALAMRKGATKEDFDSTIGIHPTNAETFTSLSVTKRSGVSTEVSGC